MAMGSILPRTNVPTMGMVNRFRPPNPSPMILAVITHISARTTTNGRIASSIRLQRSTLATKITNPLITKVIDRYPNLGPFTLEAPLATEAPASNLVAPMSILAWCVLGSTREQLHLHLVSLPLISWVTPNIRRYHRRIHVVPCDSPLTSKSFI